MARIEEFFDLRIATVAEGEEPPAKAHWVRIEDPSPETVRRLSGRGWFYKPSYVTYVLPVPSSLEEHIEETFRSRARSKPRRLLREVPRRYRFLSEAGLGRMAEFEGLYRRTIVSRPRGKDRLGEHEGRFDGDWEGFYLDRGGEMVAGVLVQAERRHLSVAYGAFDPAERDFDLEHYLILRVVEAAVARGCELVSLGMDTNRYGHHLSLGLPAYKLRIGFTPVSFEPAGREMVSVRSFAPFDEGLFFYSYTGGPPSRSAIAGFVAKRNSLFTGDSIAGQFFSREEPDLRPFRHVTTPAIRVHRIEP